MAVKNIVESWQINPQAGPEDLEAKQPFIDNGLDIHDPERYYSPAFMEKEWDRLWTRSWLIAGIETDLPEPGDYSVFRIGRESILIVRQRDGSVKAMYNVCAHRGNQIVQNDRGSVMQFTCAFHSWQYGLDGQCTGITDKETFNPELVRNNPAMKPVHCETYAGLVFVNLDDDPPPLAERFGLPGVILRLTSWTGWFVCAIRSANGRRTGRPVLTRSMRPITCMPCTRKHRT